MTSSTVHAVRLSGVLRRRVTAEHRASVKTVRGGTAWQGAVDALPGVLETWANIRGLVTIVLSNAFVRYAVVPHAGELVRSDERMALARAHFAKVYGERAREWEVRIPSCARGAPGIAIAVDVALVEALKHSFTGKSTLRLVSVQPYLMSAFNCWRHLLPATGAWIVLTEPARTCVALVKGHRWRGVSVTRETPPCAVEGCVALVERERARMAAKGPQFMLASINATKQDGSVGNDEWQVKALPFSDLPYAMALTAL